VPSDDPRDDIPSAEGPEDYGLAEDAGRGTDIDLDVTTRQEKKAGAEATGTPPQRQPLQWLDMSNWDSEPFPSANGLSRIACRSTRRDCSPAKVAPARASLS
jgi:hypothetical protein